MHGCPAIAMQDILQLIQQLLGTANAESRNQHRTTIFQGTYQHRLQARLTLLPALVKPIPIGTFDHQHIGLSGRQWGRQNWSVCGAKITGKHRNMPALPATLNKRRTKNMPGSLQAHLRPHLAWQLNIVPVIVGQRHQALLEHVEKLLHIRRRPAHSKPKGILHDYRQQLGRRPTAINRPGKALRKQPRQAPHMINVHMGQHQCLNTGNIEIDGKIVCAGPTRTLISSLK